MPLNNYHDQSDFWVCLKIIYLLYGKFTQFNNDVNCTRFGGLPKLKYQTNPYKIMPEK